MPWSEENANRIAVGCLYESAAEYRLENLRSAIKRGRVSIDGRPLRKKETDILLDALDEPTSGGVGVVFVPGQAPQIGFK
jgi:hypothetical protein